MMVVVARYVKTIPKKVSNPDTSPQILAVVAKRCFTKSKKTPAKVFQNALLAEPKEQPPVKAVLKFFIPNVKIVPMLVLVTPVVLKAHFATKMNAPSPTALMLVQPTM